MAAAAAATAAAAAAAGSDAAAAAAAAAAALHSTAALSQRIEAGIALQQARQLLQDAGILQLPSTLLAWEDEELEPEPAMQLHRGLLPPNHERPERLRAVLARLRAAGLLGEVLWCSLLSAVCLLFSTCRLRFALFAWVLARLRAAGLLGKLAVGLCKVHAVGLMLFC
jgi:hypothetical protein